MITFMYLLLWFNSSTCNLLKFVLSWMCCHAMLSDTEQCLMSSSSRFFQSYADMLTPYMNSVPAVIAKASAIHNPIIYAITHPKYRYAGAGADFTEWLRSASSYCRVLVVLYAEEKLKWLVRALKQNSTPESITSTDFQYKDLSSEMKHGSWSNTCCVIQGQMDSRWLVAVCPVASHVMFIWDWCDVHSSGPVSEINLVY